MIYGAPMTGSTGGPPRARQADPLARHSLSPSELKLLLDAERAGGSQLVLRDGDGRLVIHPLGAETLRIGRRPEMDLAITWDAEVSGLHAEFQGFGGEWTIGDEGLSRNGTYVNGQRVNGRQRLQHGDRVRVGQTLIAYKALDPAPVQETATASEGQLRQPLTDTQRRVVVALCRPLRDGGRFSTPATNQQIADELFLSVDAVKMHLRTLFSKFELAQLPQNEKRARLAETALQFGVVSQHDLR
jgi:pSer/pThr/pTyr-binding forkhead associated (FHA) protein